MTIWWTPWNAKRKTAFTALIQENLPITFLIDSDVIYVNDRLATHYATAPGCRIGPSVRPLSRPQVRMEVSSRRQPSQK